MYNHSSRHFVKLGDFKCVCPFQKYSKKECDLYNRNKSARSIFIAKNCTSSIEEHLCGWFQASREGLEEHSRFVWPALDCSTSAEKISQFIPSTGTNLARDDSQVKFVNILSIKVNRNCTEGFPRRCREKYIYISVSFARLDKVTHCNNLMFSRNTPYILKWTQHEIKFKFYYAPELK